MAGRLTKSQPAIFVSSAPGEDQFLYAINDSRIVDKNGSVAQG
jgi:hypothetical protein